MNAQLLLIFLFVLSASAFAQTVSIEGEVEKPMKMTVADLEKLPAVEVKGKDKDGKEHVFKGANLFSILQNAGIPAANKSFLSYVHITAADDYKVILTLAEIDPAFNSQTIILATSVDGKPLAKGEGPFRVVVPNDKKHARWIRDVTAIRLVSVN